MDIPKIILNTKDKLKTLCWLKIDEFTNLLLAVKH